jgi:uncharacterized protein YbjT (DUF2867 family)
VNVLSSQGNQVIAFSKNARSEAYPSNEISRVSGDMGDIKLIRQTTLGVDAVALHIPFFGDPSKSLLYAKTAIDAAVEAKVKMLVWNTSGTIPLEPTGNLAIDFRIDALKYLKSSGLSYAAFAPTAYAENLLSPWSTVYLKEKNMISYPTPIDYPVGWLPTNDLAEIMAYALKNPSLSGSHFNISSLKPYDGDQLALAFSEALGRKISYYPMPPKEFGKILDGVIGSPGAGDSAAAFYQILWDNKDFRPPIYFDQTDVNSKIPVKRTSLVDWIKNNKKVFLG